jgi:TatD DNase family protein
MIDTHVHFNNDALSRDLVGVQQRAKAAGVHQYVVVGFDLPSSAKAVEQAQSTPNTFATVGIHPHDAKEWKPETAEQLREWASAPRVGAIGEIGLDFYRDLSPRPQQYDAFRAQLTLAAEVGLPVVIHCRDAYPETLEILEAEAGETPIILHCFAGDMSDAKRAWDRGWYLGVGGTVTYKKNDALREIVRAAPQDSLLLETDAPYLTPEPLRGKFPNEPSRIPLVAACIAATRNESVETVAAYTTTNAERVFPKMLPGE